ncbi:MAG: transglutaminase-like domain-containing protein [Thermoguttaceae bacterium]
MRAGLVIAAFIVLLGTALASRAEEESKAEKSAADRGPKLGEADVQKWKFGMIVSASDGPVGRLTGTTTVPMRWPEQGLKLIGQDLSPGMTVSYKSFGSAKQMVVNIPRVADGQEVHAILTMEITRHTLLPPEETDLYVVPDAKALPPDLKQYLSPSPLIESNHARIKAIAQQLAEGQTKAWPHVHAIYDWVRKTIKYQKKSPLTGCLEAIDKGRGDCNQLTSAFIAICRASGIPARTVQIPSHCYPEFYLLDDRGRGYWFPAEASGTEAFGGILTHTPILQKGDAFRISLPDTESHRPRMKTETFRLLPSNLTSPNLEPGGGQPTLKLVCEPVEEEP